MPRGTRGSESPAKLLQNAAIWDITGVKQGYHIVGWDLKAVTFVEALLEVIGSGVTVVLRPGSGNRSLGIAIWEGDLRHPPHWLYTEEEADDWAARVLERASMIRGQAAD